MYRIWIEVANLKIQFTFFDPLFVVAAQFFSMLIRG